MTTTAPEPLTAEQIYARLEEIAPVPRMGTPDRARALAKTITVAAVRRNHRHLAPFAWGNDEASARLEHESVSVLCYEFATLHLLMASLNGRGVSVNGLAAEIADAWEDGGAIGEWLWGYCRQLGIDMDEIHRLEDALQALPAPETARQEAGTATTEGTL